MSSVFDGLVIGTLGTFKKPNTQKSILDLIVQHGGTIQKPLKLNDASLTHCITGSTKIASVTEANEERINAGLSGVWCVGEDWVLESVKNGKKEKEEDYDLTAEDEPAPAPAPAPAPVAPAAKGKRARDPSSSPEPTPSKMVKVVQKGSCPVDDRCPLKNLCHIEVDDQGAPYDAILNQTEIGKNANKFYVIQVLKDDTRASWYTFNVWGRVGESGQNKTSAGMDRASAIRDFEKKFREKTKLTWAGRNGAPVAGKYTFLERSFEDDEESQEIVGPNGEKTPQKKKQKVEDEPAMESKLEPSVQSLMAMIFNLSFLNQTLSTFEYDASKLPLGKLAKSTMEKGYLVLKEIAAMISNPVLLRSPGFATGDRIVQLTNQYYTLIPHAFGRNAPPIIATDKILKRELDLIEALGDLKITAEIMSKGNTDSNGDSVHPLDSHYMNLGLKKLDPVDKKTNEFGMLEKLVTATEGGTHGYKLTVMDAFKVERDDVEEFKKAGFDKGGERRLLWHGSRSSNYGGILSQGLRIAPPEAPVSGYMFAKGIYCASISTKSANYCYAQLSDMEGLLMLCEVQIGNKLYEREQFEYEADESCKKAGCIATWGIGRTQPAAWEDGEALSPEFKGVKMPSTTLPPKNVNSTSSLQYDEFIVYDTRQVVIRYLLRVKFGYHHAR